MSKIKKVSCFFRVFFQLIFVVSPILLAVSWVYAPAELNLFIGMIRLDPIPVSYTHGILHTLSPSEKLLGFLVSTIPLAVELFIVYSLIKLFRLYEQAEIFSLNNVRYLRNIGYALFVGQVINPFYQFVMGIVLTLNNPKGHRYAAFTFDQTNISLLLMGLLMILVSWIMAEGCKLHEEQQLTV